MMGRGMSTVFCGKNGGGVFLFALRTVTAAVVIAPWNGAGSAAAGIAKFQRGRAGFPVVGNAQVMPVRFAACAGVFGSTTVLLIEYIFLIIVGAGDWFWHGVTCNFCGV
jgi:hypothetical protein